MAIHYFLLDFNGKELCFTQAEPPFTLYREDDILSLPPTWAVHSCLGDDNKIWCEVYRMAGEQGGFFIMRDFDEALFVAHAQDNISFVFAMDTFAKMVSNYRYAADIFENIDDA